MLTATKRGLSQAIETANDLLANLYKLGLDIRKIRGIEGNQLGTILFLWDLVVGERGAARHFWRMRVHGGEKYAYPDLWI